MEPQSLFILSLQYKRQLQSILTSLSLYNLLFELLWPFSGWFSRLQSNFPSAALTEDIYLYDFVILLLKTISMAS